MKLADPTVILIRSLVVVATMTGPLSAVVVYVPFPDGPTFHSGGANEEGVLIPLDVPGGDSSSLWLRQGGANAHLVSEGPVRVVVTQSPPPNIGGLVRAMDGGSIIGSSLGEGAAWFGGEAVDPDSPSLMYHILYLAQTTPYAVSEFFKQTAYIGIEFRISGQLHYGWFSVETPMDGTGQPGFEPYRSRITGFAYETEAGIPITAGVVPEPHVSTLLLTGLGAAFARRRNPSTRGKAAAFH